MQFSRGKRLLGLQEEVWSSFPFQQTPPVGCWTHQLYLHPHFQLCSCVSLIGCPSNGDLICPIDKACRSQQAFISLLCDVRLFILPRTTEPSCPATFRLVWSPFCLDSFPGLFCHGGHRSLLSCHVPRAPRKGASQSGTVCSNLQLCVGHKLGTTEQMFHSP